MSVTRAFFVAIALSLAAPSALADDAGTTAAASTATLAPLPEVPKLERAAPSEAELEELDALLARFRSEDPGVRETAQREILEVRATLVSAIDFRMNQIADKADRDELKRTLEDIRKRGRAQERERMKAAGKKGKIETPDYLQMVLDNAKPAAKPWQDLVSVLAMSRILVQIGTVDSARELIDVFVRFGEFLRVDTQLQLEKMGDKAVAALIEARRHKAEKIGRWAERQLDTMGKAIASEAVQTEDHQVLADVLRAYGRVRDPDAARIVISFANSERAQVREASRQAVAMMGEVGAWQLRDTYETIIGKKPPRDWSWERTARELFGAFDRMRLAQVHQLFDDGAKAQKEAKLEEMRAAYDKVLARSPMFERRAEMAAGYFAYAEKFADEKPAEALSALRRAERIAADEALKKRITSRMLVLEAEELLARGIADQTLFRRAIELDPTNARAKDGLARIERGELEKKSQFGRYAAAGAIGFIALIAIGVVGLRRGRRKDEPEPGSTDREPVREPTDAKPEPQTEPEKEAKPAPEPELNAKLAEAPAEASVAREPDPEPSERPKSNDEPTPPTGE